MKVYLVTHWVCFNESYPIDIYQNIDEAKSAAETLAHYAYNDYIKFQEDLYNYEKDTKFKDFAIWDENTLEMEAAYESVVIEEFELK